MTEWLKELFVSIFGSNSWLATLIISMIPIIELRGAIPFGSATALWGENALPVWESLIFSVIGCSIVCVILTFLFWPIFKWLKNTKALKKFANVIENKLNNSSKSINDKAQAEKNEKKIHWIKWWGVFVFVAIPLPLTGVWTGTCVALFIGLSKKDTMLSVIFGNMVAGLIMLAITYLFGDNTMIVIWLFLALVAIFAIVIFVNSLVKKIKKRKTASIEKIEGNESFASAENVESDVSGKDLVDVVESENNNSDADLANGENVEMVLVENDAVAENAAADNGAGGDK